MGGMDRVGRASPRHWAVIAVLLMVVVTLLARGPRRIGFSGQPPTNLPAAADLPRLEIIAPGTRLTGGPPPGWTHLVVKSIPRLATGDLSTLPASAGSTAGLIRTLVLAEVRGGTLLRVGVGLCVPDRGGEVVVTAGGRDSPVVRLSWIARRVLARGSRDLAQSRLLARSPTFAVFESPSRLVVDGRHRDVQVRHALLAGPGGDLGWCVWAVGADPEPRQLVSAPVVLRAGSPSDCGLDVAAERVLGAVPVSWSFAMKSLPTGRPLPMNPRLRLRVEADAMTGSEATSLEAELRAALRPAVSRVAPLARRPGNR